MLKQKWFTGICIASLLALSATTHSARGAQQPGEADVVYKNGFVYTVDAVRTRAQAFALRDGKFLAVGSNDDMKAVTGKDTKVVDAKMLDDVSPDNPVFTVLQGHTVYEAK